MSPGTADRTQERLVRRMVVARGRLVGHDIAPSDHVVASHAAAAAVKAAPSLLAGSDAFTPEHIDCFLMEEDGDPRATAATVTVQAHTRADMAPATRAGVAAALIAIAADGESVQDLVVVQSVADLPTPTA